MPTKKKPKFRVGQVVRASGLYAKVYLAYENGRGGYAYEISPDGLAFQQADGKDVRPLTAREVGPGWKRMKGD